MWDLIVSVPDHCLSFYFPKFGQAASGAKRKVMFDVTDVTLCKHSETLAPFSCPAFSK